MLVAEGVIQTAAPKAHVLYKVLNRSALISLFPEQAHGFVQCLLRLKRFLSCHRLRAFLSSMPFALFCSLPQLPPVYTMLERKVKDVFGEFHGFEMRSF